MPVKVRYFISVLVSSMAYRGRDYNEDSAASLLRSVRQQVSYIFVVLIAFNVIWIITILLVDEDVWICGCCPYFGHFEVELV